MKLRLTIAFLSLLALAIVLPVLAQPDLAQTDVTSASTMPEEESLATREQTSIANDRDVSTDAVSLAEDGSFATTAAADGSSVDSSCHICVVLRDLCFAEGIFTPRQCVQQYRACVEDLCS